MNSLKHIPKCLTIKNDIYANKDLKTNKNFILSIVLLILLFSLLVFKFKLIIKNSILNEIKIDKNFKLYKSYRILLIDL